MIIWLASYPRSGNTFTRTILWKLLGQKTYSTYPKEMHRMDTEEMGKVVGHEELPEDFNLQEARDCDKVFFIKTHEKNSPLFDQDKVIYIVRDGRDAVCSYFHFQRNFDHTTPSLIEIIRDERFPSDWSEHVQSWHPQTRPNTLFLRFEQITKDPIGTARQISKFASVPVQSDQIPSFEELHALSPKFFRQGKNNGYKQQMTPSEHKFFWLKHGEAMREMGYTDDEPHISWWDKMILSWKYRSPKKRK